MDSGYRLQCSNCGTQIGVPHGETRVKRRCPGCGMPLIPGHALPQEVTDETWEAEVLGSAAPVVVEVWGPECEVCAQYELAVRQMAVDMYGEARVLQLNIEENPRTAARYGIQGVPTVLLFAGGRHVATLPGPRGVRGIRERLGLA